MAKKNVDGFFNRDDLRYIDNASLLQIGFSFWQQNIPWRSCPLQIRGKTNCLSKPFLPMEFLGKIEEMMGKKG